MRALILHLAAPMMSFGAEVLDKYHPTRPCPPPSLMVGLLGNALGYDFRDDAEEHRRLEKRLAYAVRADQPGRMIRDYHTVDLRSADLRAGGWTTAGRPEIREERYGEQTHETWRDYLADAVYTVALCLSEGQGPTLDDLAQALIHPARPLYLGRACCLPAAPLLRRKVEADGLVAALEAEPLGVPGQPAGLRLCWWPALPGEPEGERRTLMGAYKDWGNQAQGGDGKVFGGRYQPWEGMRPAPAGPHAPPAAAPAPLPRPEPRVRPDPPTLPPPREQVAPRRQSTGGPLHLVQLQIEVPQLRGLLRAWRMRWDEDYALHTALGELFGELRPQPFLISSRTGDDRRWFVLGHSQADAEALRAHAQRYAEPQKLRILADLVSKPMVTDWQPGEELQFQVRLCPVVRRRDNTELSVEVARDLDRDRAADDLAAHGIGCTPADAVLVRWLAEAMERRGGARLVRAQAEGRRSLRTLRRNDNRRLRSVTMPEAHVRGWLAVTNGAAFVELLRRGIGRQTGFGFGLLRLRTTEP